MSGMEAAAAQAGQQQDLAELEDVSNSEAYKVINKLLEAKEISPQRANDIKLRFSALHASVVQAMTREAQLLEEAKGLKRKLDDDIALATRPAVDPNAPPAENISTLREDVESALSEAALAQERQQLLQLEVTDLQRSRNELVIKMEELQAEQAAALQPLISSMRGELQDMRADVEEERAKAQAAARDVGEAKARLTAIQNELATQSERKAAERQQLSKVDPLPDKARRQAEAVGTMLKSVASQVDTATARLNEFENQYKMHVQRERELTEEHQRLLMALDKLRVTVEAKDRHADDVRKDVELAGIEADKIMADQVDLDIKLKTVTQEHKMEADTLARRQRERDLILRSVRNVEGSLRQLQEMMPNMRYQHDQLRNDRNHIESDLASKASGLVEVKRDLDISMSDFLQEENMGKEKVAEFQASYKHVQLLERELMAMKGEEATRNKVLMDLGSQRDRVALSIAQKLAKVKEVQQQGLIKNVELAELKKIKRQTNRRIKDFEKLYDLVKNQRNKFVNLIQSSNQAITEMKDKLKILTNELDILHAEVHDKDRLLGQKRALHTSSVAERDQLRIELGKLGTTFREKQAVVDEQIAEVDKLNAIINQAEKEMMHLKRQYQVAIEARNYTGVMLIDRNDELCVLYEKANIQQEVTKAGQLELQRRDDEHRLLRIEVQALHRSIEVTKKVAPQIPLLDMDVARLQKALLETRREAEALSLELEDPNNNGRWRMLEGKIPDKEELSAKIQQLEERLNDKKEQLLEKELILEEITSLSDRLRMQAAEGRGDTLELAKRVNEYQSKLRAITRKIMATVSELSMYQATSLKLDVEKVALEGEVVTGRERLAAGMPPTEEAEREWGRLEREVLVMASVVQQREEVVRAQEAKLAEVQTTADARPNAYIPESLGIPKPYGGFAPFKPSEQGSTMRHIRKPQPKEIII